MLNEFITNQKEAIKRRNDGDWSAIDEFWGGFTRIRPMCLENGKIYSVIFEQNSTVIHVSHDEIFSGEELISYPDYLWEDILDTLEGVSK
jgi:hypothetical protein